MEHQRAIKNASTIELSEDSKYRKQEQNQKVITMLMNLQWLSVKIENVIENQFKTLEQINQEHNKELESEAFIMKEGKEEEESPIKLSITLKRQPSEANVHFPLKRLKLNSFDVVNSNEEATFSIDE